MDNSTEHRAGYGREDEESRLSPFLLSILGDYHLFELMEAAGMPPGVINFLPGHGPDVGNPATVHPDLGGIHFTGSTSTFNWLWKQVGTHVDSYKTYPRIVGETGGKDFIFAHASADPSEIATAILRGAFEYQGQKCSAASRAFIPESLWPEIKRQVQEQLVQFKVGDVEDFKNFMGAVIDAPSFKKITGYLDRAKADTGATIISGGGYDDAVGYFIEPTIVQVDDPNHELMTDELFGPVLGVFVYPDAQFEETLKICDEGAIYALTGAIFATDRQVIVQATDALRHSAGNFYINDKPTGAVVGQQPFGGSRKSGTNDKAGSLLNLLRWTSPRTIKENLLPARNWRYPFLS